MKPYHGPGHAQRGSARPLASAQEISTGPGYLWLSCGPRLAHGTFAAEAWTKPLPRTACAQASAPAATWGPAARRHRRNLHKVVIILRRLWVGRACWALVNNPRCERWLRLREFVRQCEIRIVAAEHRIDRHQKLWPIIAADPCQRRAHLQLERNLLEGLMLLHAQRAIFLHELNGAQIPRTMAAPAQSHPHELSKTDAVRHDCLARTIVWLDCLPHATALCDVIAGQRDRALRELLQIKRQQLLRTGRPFLHDGPADLSEASSPSLPR